MSSRASSLSSSILSYSAIDPEGSSRSRRRSSATSWLDEEDKDRAGIFVAPSVLQTFDFEEQRQLLEKFERQRTGGCSGKTSSGASPPSAAVPTVRVGRVQCFRHSSSYFAADEYRGRASSLPSPPSREMSRVESASIARGSAIAGSNLCGFDDSTHNCSKDDADASPEYDDLVQDQQAIWEAIMKRQRQEEEEEERLRRQCHEEEKEAAAAAAEAEAQDAEEIRRRYSERAEESDKRDEEEVIVGSPHELSRVHSARQLMHMSSTMSEGAASSASMSSFTSSSLSTSMSSSLSSSLRSSATSSSRRPDVLRSMRGQGDAVSPSLLASAKKDHEGDGSFDQVKLLEVYAGQSMRLFDRRDEVLRSEASARRMISCGGCRKNFFVSRGCKIMCCPECETLTPTSLTGNATAA